jgi:hypothetical protein
MKSATAALALVLVTSPAMAITLEHMNITNLSVCKVHSSSSSTSIAQNEYGTTNTSTSQVLKVICPLQPHQPLAPNAKLAYKGSGGVCVYDEFRQPGIYIWDVHPTLNVACTLKNLNTSGAVNLSWSVQSAGENFANAVPYRFPVLESPAVLMTENWVIVCDIPPKSAGGAASAVQVSVLHSCSVH